ncbi:MAG: flagellar biosynthetic protein FliO [Lachnospiraceae bacterium]|nr:flagellar biosynthetic protein FliO [Lachnospiraceae bacterium]
MILTVSQGLNSIAQFFTVLFVFLFVCGITWLATRYIARLQQGAVASGNMELIEAFRIAPGKYIQIVKVGEKYLALAICKDTVTLLAELHEDEVKLPEKKELVSFKELLEKAIKRTDKDE